MKNKEAPPRLQNNIKYTAVYDLTRSHFQAILDTNLQYIKECQQCGHAFYAYKSPIAYNTIEQQYYRVYVFHMPEYQAYRIQILSGTPRRTKCRYLIEIDQANGKKPYYGYRMDHLNRYGDDFTDVIRTRTKMYCKKHLTMLD